MNVVSFVQNNDSLFFMKFKCSMAFLVRRHYLCMCVCVCVIYFPNGSEGSYNFKTHINRVKKMSKRKKKLR